MTEEPEFRSTPNSSRRGRWFWVAMTAGAALAVSLTLYQGPLGPDPSLPPDDSRQGQVEEIPPHDLAKKLERATQASVAKIVPLLETLIDRAYEPAFEAIPAFADFHYSYPGQYLELADAASGNTLARIQEKLFSDLDERLDEIGPVVDVAFAAAFRRHLVQSFPQAESDSSVVGQLTDRAIDDAVQRMNLTTPIAATAALGGTLTLRAASAALAKKIARQFALKLAARVGGKSALALTSAATSTLACSWGGPGALVCGLLGGVAAWVIADYGILKIDEFWNREDFKNDIRKLIEEQKMAHKELFKDALYQRAIEVQSEVNLIAQEHEIRLKDLYGVGLDDICDEAFSIYQTYAEISKHIRNRNPGYVSAFKDGISPREESFILSGLVLSIIENLSESYHVFIRDVVIVGQLPDRFRQRGQISAELLLNGMKLTFEDTTVSRNEYFRLITHDNEIELYTLFYKQHVDYSLTIGQHRRLREDNLFEGSGRLKVWPSSDAVDGLIQTIEIPIYITANQDSVTRAAEDLDVEVASATVNVSISVQALPLADVQLPTICRQRQPTRPSTSYSEALLLP